MIVDPARDIPGMSAKAWATPTLSASRHVIASTLVDANPMVAALGPQDQQPADDERERDRGRVETEYVLIQSPNASPSTASGVNAIATLATKRRARRVVDEPAQDLPVARAILPDHGHDGAGLDHDREHFRALVVEAEQLLRDDQMPGARDRKELGQSFDNPEDQCFDDVETQMRATTFAGRIFSSCAISVHGQTGT